MHKILISHPIVGSYSAFLFLGLLTGYLLTRRQARRAGIKGSHIDNLALLIALVSLFGARFFSWLFYFPPGVSLWNALRDSSGGMVFYGGLIFGALGLVLYAVFAKLSLTNLLDVFAPGLALGLAFGRIGCFLAGCCWGDLCIAPGQLAGLSPPTLAWQVHTLPLLSSPSFPLALRFPKGAGAYEQHQKLGLIDTNAELSQPVHPVQLYEAALAFGLCLFLLRKFSGRKWNGQTFWILIGGYSLIRFLLEFLRADNPPIYFHFTLSQVISLLLGAIALVALLTNRRSVSPIQPVEALPSASVPSPSTAISQS